MSVLSFSDVQYVGEQKPGTKSVDEILEESTLLQVDCPQQRAGGNLSNAVCDRKQILLEVDYSRQVPDNDRSEDNHGENDNLKEPDCAPRRPIDERLNDIHAAEKPLPNVDCSQQWQGDEKQYNCYEDNARFPITGSPELMDNNLSNVKEDIYKVELRNCRTELHSFSGKGSCLGEEQGVCVIESLFESNNCAFPAEDGERDGINESEETVDAPFNADSILSNTSDSHVENGDTPSALRKLSNLACRADFEHINLSAEGQDNELFSADCNSLQIMQIMECKVQKSNHAGGFGLPRTAEYAEQDYPVALWVKWRGKWQTGIRCSRADCPFPTLRAKPTHERKKYIAVFFPRTRTYSWADMLLVRPIDESPEPLAHGTHRRWRKLVKDLTVARRYIMQKLAVAMLNISDQLHTEAVIENARKALTWKEFAMEASHCRDYSDLGRMLLKLQTMILPSYTSHDWLKNSFDSWVQRCQSAQSAESIEILTEELVNSVTWNKVDELWNAPVQPELGPEWKTWKQEAMKWFLTSHPIASRGGIEQRHSDSSMGLGSQISKRPKLEVRRAESYASQMEASRSRIVSQLNSVDSNSGHSNCQGAVEHTPSCEPKFLLTPEVGMSADGGNCKTAMGNAHRETDITNKYRQCSAFIEAKGRQCGRWANDGDIYCCVHLNIRSLGKPSQEEQMFPVETSMCEGMTTHGNKCKHRARHGSQFCKKHFLQGSHDSVSTENFLGSSDNKLKRKHDEEKILEKTSSSNLINGEGYGEIQTPMKDNLIPIIVGEMLDERNCLMKKSELYNALPTTEGSGPDSPRCIGFHFQNNSEQCLEKATRHTLYCEKHLPKFLKRARNGKSRLVSKDVFINLLRECSSRKQKLYLHQACELLYGFMKGSLSRQKPVSKGDSVRWILSEASNDLNVVEYLLKLVSSEREKITRLWGFDAGKGKQKSSSETNVLSVLEKHEDHGAEKTVKCKICGEEFTDDQKLGAHWTEFHKKEGRWLFRGYACAVCMNSFTNRKVLETHVKERHGMQFLENSILFRCMSCSSHFVNPEQLWQHVLSFHLMDFRMPHATQEHKYTIDQPVQPKMELSNKLCQNNALPEKEDGSQRFMCRFCGLKFDLLPDLGRHHQVAHMNPISINHFPPKRGNNNLKRTRRCHPGFKKSFATAFRFKNQSSFGMQKRFQSSNSVFSERQELQTQAAETVALGKLLESHCSDVAESLFSQMQKTKPRPSNLEILSIARSACCRISLHATLEMQFGILPENLYLKAAKLCSELNIEVDWHLEGFICPKGCRSLVNPHSLSPLKSLPDVFVESLIPTMDPMNDSNWEMDECHYILHPKHFNWKPRRKAIILCEDVSFGKESVPVACVLDEEIKNSLHINSDEASNQELDSPMPWQGFTYVTERLIEPSLGLDTKNSQLGCACPAKCSPEKCDHVYLFDNDYENAEDIHGKPMHGRFPYDERGRIVLKEGYLLYECNSLCHCDATCHNRVLQKGVQVKLEIFQTEKKGWAVRAGEAISRGTFVCEYIGEVLNDVEANKRGERYDTIGCSYLYDIDAHIDGGRSWNEGTVPYVIDATKYGNVSRFINHSCSPNLVNYLVLVESMDCQLAHIGLYASQDIAAGDELAYDYRYKLLPGDGCPCHCGAPNCRGRLY